MIYIRFKSFYSHNCVIAIDNGSEEVTEITPSSNPFVTDVDSDDDLFCPIRTQSGKLEIVAELDTLSNLIGKNPLQRKVTLYVDNAVAWVGYLQSTTYSQPWDCGMNKITIPVKSPLAILDSFEPSSEYLGLTSFVKLIKSCCDAFGTSPFSKFVFPKLSEPGTTLKYYFLMLNYAKWDSDLSKWKVSSYKDILEDICKTFGWQCVEIGDRLCFLALDSTEGYISYTYDNLLTLSNGEEIDYDTLGINIHGADHTIDYVPGKKKVSVECKVNKLSETLYSFGTSELKVAHSYTHKHTRVTEEEYYFSESYDSSDEISVCDDENVRFENWILEANTYCGSWISKDRVARSYKDYNYKCDYDSGFSTYIGFNLVHDTPPPYIVKITPHNRHHYHADLDDACMYINFSINKRDNYNSEETAAYEGPIHMKVTIGSEVHFDENVYYHDGVLCKKQDGVYVSNTYGNKKGLAIGSYSLVAANNNDGQIKIELIVDPDSYSDMNNHYYEISSFEVGYTKSWNTGSFWVANKREEKGTNVEETSINDGFTEDYSVSLGLTTYDNNESGTNFINADKPNGDTPLYIHVGKLYDNKTVEKALCDRLYNYYKQTRKRIKVDIKGNGTLLSPFGAYSLGNENESFVCTSQSVNWRNDIITATFNEIPSNDEQ